ncbi:MAG: hypothetical protein IKX14_02890 [Neisseriaceae bacterium]|nr:hypothetical protein [Neisseriaceae bacterium]
MENNIQNIVQDIYSFSSFVSNQEKWTVYSDKISSLWNELEIINAIALDEWDKDNRPLTWRKWKEKYQKNARDCSKIFLEQVRLLLNNKISDILLNFNTFSKFFNMLERDDFFLKNYFDIFRKIENIYFLLYEDNTQYNNEKEELKSLLNHISIVYPERFLSN